MMFIDIKLTSLIYCGSFIVNLSIHLVESRATILKSNQMRYANNEGPSFNLMPLSHLFELTSASSKRTIAMPHNRNRHDHEEITEFHEGRFLDDEDKRLLDQFYRETKDSDPFLSDDLSTESLWIEDERKRENQARLRKINKENYQPEKNLVDQTKEGLNYDGWTFDESIIDGLNGKPYEYNLGPSIEDSSRAEYSPTFDLLTTYQPIQSISREPGLTDQEDKLTDLLKSNNRIVGATLFGRDQNLKPSVSSKSAVEAIKLHNDMLRRPPNDGKVRVRMYYHRAIHDDAKLYGTGPWKYWGHGWGLEYGYDPRQKNKDFYQRGYTMERAYGRDFCKDNKNCRKSDPKFFQDPRSVGKYSEQYYKGIKKSST